MAALFAEWTRLTEVQMEKRRFSRIVLNMAAELTVDDTVYSFMHVDNLSVGGCLLKTGECLREGTACRFWLPLEPADPHLSIEAFGEIVRCDGESVSVRFTRITPESLFHLQNVIRFNAPDPDRIDGEIMQHPGLV